jgi:hypothetical protein
MRTCIQDLAQTVSAQGADWLLRQQRSAISQQAEKTEKALLAAKKDKACRASQMKLFWVFQLEPVAPRWPAS